MFKELKRYQVRLTPFQASVDWNLNNTENADLLLFESTGSDDGEPIDLEYIDYSSGVPVDNYNCQIALEQQEADKAVYREAQQGSGPFYPDTELTNTDGTFQRVIYSQVRTSFYNDYRDPTKIWGVDNIDFENSKTKRRLTDKLRLFEIPRSVFGDKMTSGTILIRDHSLDNDYIILDDGYGNLIAQKNLFSKQQEIGEFINEFEVGTNDVCDDYFSGSTTCLNWEDTTENWEDITYNWENCTSSSLSAPSDLDVISGSAILTWTDNSNNEAGFVIEKSLDSSSWSQYITTSANVSYSIDTNVTESNTYWYRVFAFNSETQSVYSNTASITFTPAFPCVGDNGIENLEWSVDTFNYGFEPFAGLSGSATGSTGEYWIYSTQFGSVAVDISSSLCNPTTESYDLTISASYLITMAAVSSSDVSIALQIGDSSENINMNYVYPTHSGSFTDTLTFTRTIFSQSAGTLIRIYCTGVGSDISGSFTLVTSSLSIPIAPSNLTLTSSI